jgi:hypothetical protein
MVRKFLASRSIRIATVCIVAFWVVLLIAPRNETIELLRITQASMAAAVAVAFSSLATYALLKIYPDRVEQMSMGVALGFFSSFGFGFWALLWRLAGKPDWMLESSVQAFWIYLSILAGALHITAPGAVDGRIPRPNKIALGTAVGAGVLVFLLLLWTVPDLSQPMEAIRPYIP